ncbi:hypothetical protein C8J57DRAFT_1227931 [Mycena rebaudengoi]|nr:hypothetical protein C8J57DRAFT_1227931 [Mycena rebaudengoi]
MDSRRPKFRPLLPKPLSQARPEPCLISTPSNQYASSHQETTGTSSAHVLSAKAYGRIQSEFERRSLDQKKRRQRESKENKSNMSLFCPFQPKGSKHMNPHRSAAQRARRQRELAANIEDVLQTKIFDLELKYYEGKLKKEKGVWSQTLIVVYPTQALDRALDHEYDVNEPRRQDRYRESYRSQMLRYVAERHGAS